MQRSLLALTMLALFALAACGEDAEQPSPEPAPKQTGNQLTFTLPEFEVPEGESFTCFWTDIYTEEELAVSTSFGQQGAGGHHLTVYYTEDPQNPHFKPCEDKDMESWRLVAASGGDDGGVPVAALPEGAAIRVPAGKQIVIQVHYINFTVGPFMSEDVVTLNLMAPEEVREYASSFVVLNKDFMIPPNTDRYESRSPVGCPSTSTPFSCWATNTSRG